LAVHNCAINVAAGSICSSVLVNWNLWGEEAEKGRSRRQKEVMKLVPVLVALDVSEKYQFHIHLPLEHLEQAQSLQCQ
jgi:hypothetical protein